MRSDIIALSGLLFALVEPASASDGERVFGCSIDNSFVRQDDRLFPANAGQKAFVAKWLPATVTDKKPFRFYSAATVDLDLPFATTRGFRKITHYFDGAWFASELTTPGLFVDGAQTASVSDTRTMPPEEAVKEIGIEGIYVGGDSSIVFYRLKGLVLTYALNLLEGPYKEGKIFVLYGVCSENR